MTVSELRKALDGFEEESPVIIALFKNDSTAEIFDPVNCLPNGATLQINIEEDYNKA